MDCISISRTVFTESLRTLANSSREYSKDVRHSITTFLISELVNCSKFIVVILFIFILLKSVDYKQSLLMEPILVH